MVIHVKQAGDNIRQRLIEYLSVPEERRNDIIQIVEEELADWDIFPKDTVLVGDVAEDEHLA